MVGLILTGSRGRGFRVRPDSDFDVRLVLREEASDDCAQRYETSHGAPVETRVLSVSAFERTGTRGADDEWDRYSYVRAPVVIDKLDGHVQSVVDEKSQLMPAERRELAAEWLDTYVNAYYRAARNHQNDLESEAHLDAAESVSPFLTALFALHGRVRPFNKFLCWELERCPLGDDRWAAARLISRLRAIVATGDLHEQQRLFCDVEELARQHEFGPVVDGWEPHVSWLRGPAG